MPTPKTTATPAPIEGAAAAMRRPRLLTTDDLASLLQLHPDVVKRMRQSGDGPPFVKLGRSRIVRYQPRAVSEWLDAQQRTSTKDSSRRSNSDKREARS